MPSWSCFIFIILQQSCQYGIIAVARLPISFFPIWSSELGWYGIQSWRFTAVDHAGLIRELCSYSGPGFYTRDPQNPSSLILAPFHGKPACQTIAIGRGVCGAAAAENRIVRVQDVREFAGHIACDGDSRSEIVVPILVDERVSLLQQRVSVFQWGSMDTFDPHDWIACVGRWSLSLISTVKLLEASMRWMKKCFHKWLSYSLIAAIGLTESACGSRFKI